MEGVRYDMKRGGKDMGVVCGMMLGGRRNDIGRGGNEVWSNAQIIVRRVCLCILTDLGYNQPKAVI
ncbi:MAG: hypothetical protein A2Y72_06840 [Chloroflexi bacterium RBG_13_53_26]|jgi:hypothetical protein|nr:MAG: hypothetical protein A2Y72_06840 [Chloroflexi bacterium RBG_13_53_26]